ncbi:MAG: hypothetical protein LBR46_05320 [Prevotella sp.]|jgi:hypothetical protein|nr:hypothetical protein [Prevotella sp.]
MKIIYTKLIPPSGFLAITLFGLVFAKRKLTNEEQNHEAIHIRQGRELLWIFFYLWYVIEWVIRLIQYRDRKQAYRNISFEREAYSNQSNLGYIKIRKYFEFIKYLSINK